MPYFIERRGDKHCVMKGVKGQEGNETMKCHDDPKSAQKHLSALMVNAEDAKAIDGARGGRGIEEKAELSSGARGNLPDSAFLYIESGGEKDESGKTTPRSLRHLPYRNADGSLDLAHLRNAITRLSQSATGTGKDSWLTPALRESLLARARKLLKDAGSDSEDKSEDKSIVTTDERSDHDHSKFISYKSGDQWRWLAISSTAVEDREYETVSEKAYDDAIQFASLNGYGELDLVHVDGTEVGYCDQMFRVGQSLLEGGTWDDSDLAQKVREIVQVDPDKWGVSIKFQYDPEQFDGSIYHGGIRILKRSILPRKMAASLGTAIVVQGGKMMKAIDETTKEALMELGMEETEVEQLAEQQKSQEPNVKEKIDEETLLERLKKLFLGTPEQTAQPDAEERSKETDMEEQGTPETQEKQESESDSTPLSELVLTDEAVKTISLRTAEVLSPAIAKALNPVIEQLGSLVEWSESVQKRLAEVEKDIETKVAEKIDSLPPVVKVRTTELKQAETAEQPEVAPTVPSGKNAEFVQSVADIVAQALGTAFGSGEFKL